MTARALRPATAAELEFDALKAIEASVKLAAGSLAGMYEVPSENIENAIRKLVDAANDVWRERNEIEL